MVLDSQTAASYSGPKVFVVVCAPDIVLTKADEELVTVVNFDLTSGALSEICLHVSLGDRPKARSEIECNWWWYHRKLCTRTTMTSLNSER